MPRLLFYVATAFCLFLALASAGEVARELRAGTVAFVALPAAAHVSWALGVALVAGLSIATLFLRMAALLAARNLFAAFVAVFCTACATSALVAVVLLQWRIAESGGAAVAEVHAAALMALGLFVSLSFVSLHSYFSIQASRFLSALVFFPLPLFAVLLGQEMFARAAASPMPAATPASRVFFSVVAVLFFSIAVHCVRHRHLFLEMTNLRELLDAPADPRGRHGRPIGGVAFDS